MVIHDRVLDSKGVGKWDIGTTRYIPVSGGSRSRLPVHDDPAYRRYFGFVGISEELTADIFTLPALYAYLGGAPVVHEGHGSVFVKLILDETLKHLQAGEEEKEKEK